jgi:hypothetical protein
MLGYSCGKGSEVVFLESQFPNLETSLTFESFREGKSICNISFRVIWIMISVKAMEM